MFITAMPAATRVAPRKRRQSPEGDLRRDVVMVVIVSVRLPAGPIGDHRKGARGPPPRGRRPDGGAGGAAYDTTGSRGRLAAGVRRGDLRAVAATGLRARVRHGVRARPRVAA